MLLLYYHVFHPKTSIRFQKNISDKRHAYYVGLSGVFLGSSGRFYGETDGLCQRLHLKPLSNNYWSTWYENTRGVLCRLATWHNDSDVRGHLSQMDKT